jgi:hypothetical protein
MKKGSRRKGNKRHNRHHRAPQGVKAKRLRANPAFGALDQKAMRKMLNQSIGTMLINALDIDFVGIMDKVEEEKRDKPITETIQ